MTPEDSRIFSKASWFWKDLQKLHFGPQTDFSIVRPLCCFSFRPKLTFWVTNLEIRPVEYVHMDHTDHFYVQHNVDFDL